MYHLWAAKKSKYVSFRLNVDFFWNISDQVFDTIFGIETDFLIFLFILLKMKREEET